MWYVVLGTGSLNHIPTRIYYKYYLFAYSVIFQIFVVICWHFFSKYTVTKTSFSNTIRVLVSNCLDPDQDQHSVGPDLFPNCLQRLSADDKSLLARKELVRQYSLNYPCTVEGYQHKARFFY